MNQDAWKKVKLQWYYGSLFISVAAFLFTIIGFFSIDSETLYVDQYASGATFVVTSIIAFKLKNVPKENT
jgi:hypothetical protein